MASYENSIIYLYNTLVGRDPDQAGFDYWLDQLDSGSIELGSVAEALISSPEYTNVKEGIVRLYKAAFGRIPDKEGLDYWAGKIDGGVHNLQDVSTLFITSPEFDTRFGVAPSLEQIVTKMYQNTFARTPDAEGFDYWVGQVQNGLTISDLLLNFTESPEGISRLNNHTQTVVMYDSLTGRMPTALEVLSAPEQIASMVATVISKSDYQGPDLGEPSSSITTSFSDGALELIGSLSGQLAIDATQSSIKQAGFNVSVTDMDWEALTDIDVSAATGFPIQITGGDSALNLTIGTYTQEAMLGGGDDTVTLDGLPTQEDLSIDGGLGANSLIFSKGLAVDVSEGAFRSFQTITGSEFGDVLKVSTEDLMTVTIDLGGNADEGFDKLQLTDGGLVDLSNLDNVIGVERWEFADNSVYDFIGSDSSDHLTVGIGGGRYAGGAGGDYFNLSEGPDYLAYGAATESMQNSDSLIFTGDVISNFNFNKDFIDLPVVVDGGLSFATVDSAFYSNLVDVLSNDANVTAALAADADGDDIDAVLVEVSAGGAAGVYLIVQGSASATGYNETTDMIIQLVGIESSNMSALNLI